MAVGDFTIDGNTLRATGNVFTVDGTLEVDTNATPSAIFPNGYIKSFAFTSNSTDLDVSLPKLATNASDFSGTAASGSVHVDASGGAPDTLNWTADFLM